MPIGAHMLLSFLAEPLKQPKDSLLSLNEQDVSDNLLEFEDWVGPHLCSYIFCGFSLDALTSVVIYSVQLMMLYLISFVSSARVLLL